MATSMKAAKKALRAQIKTTLDSLDAGSVSDQSSIAQKTLLQLPAYKQAKHVSIYLSMPSGEASTELIVKNALAEGKTVYVPYIYKKTDQSVKPSRAMDMLRLQSLEEYDCLQRDSWGIPTLPEHGIQERMNAFGGRGLSLAGVSEASTEPRLDLIVVPGVAFDRGLHRLGHGAGYYDTFLSRYNADSSQKRPLLEQVLPGAEAIPVTELDWKVDKVVSGEGLVLPQDA